MKSYIEGQLISTEELEVEVSAFIHFLNSTKKEISISSELPAFWMLIPKRLEVKWENIKHLCLEKEVTSRTVFIVHPEIPDELKPAKRTELITIFSPVITNQQTEEIIKLLKALKPGHRDRLIQKYNEYLKDQEN